ncbi:MAG: tRNA (N(6)-L-threonylcarbamoyladenosine(37)-C(2))-methylthiotransferase MtaB, partial [Lachnospiraceae bacterium]|nr:tRNA (N(6)-L-threonylcarbamoyladenosine(37)-C(2))-methylthiotransferase MtaB [Lachnospiraceae bacterium]
MIKPHTAALHNLGCKVNGYELDIMQQKLREKGYEIVPFEEKADIYIINTCTVTGIADRKSRQMLHRARKQNPDALVVAVGCYAETGRAQVEQDDAVDLLVGNNKKGEIVELIEAYLEGDGSNKTLGGATYEDLTEHPAYESAQLKTPTHTRAYIKIQDGCNQFCTYCLIPYARGRIRSRDPEEILQEIRTLSESGIREVVLTGIHVSSYGRDRGEQPDEALLQLMTRIQMLGQIRRIRLSSLEPRIMTEGFVSGISRLSKVCPHFHLSLQSGCDETLRRMNRHYSAQEYAEVVERLRRYYENPAITTDVIVGFPGETEEEYASSKAFIEQIHFYETHVFPFSARKGTAAAGMKGQLPGNIKQARSEQLIQLSAQRALEFRSLFDGQEEEVLLEELSDDPDYY